MIDTTITDLDTSFHDQSFRGNRVRGGQPQQGDTGYLSNDGVLPSQSKFTRRFGEGVRNRICSNTEMDEFDLNYSSHKEYSNRREQDLYHIQPDDDEDDEDDDDVDLSHSYHNKQHFPSRRASIDNAFLCSSVHSQEGRRMGSHGGFNGIDRTKNPNSPCSVANFDDTTNEDFCDDSFGRDDVLEDSSCNDSVARCREEDRLKGFKMFNAGRHFDDSLMIKDTEFLLDIVNTKGNTRSDSLPKGDLDEDCHANHRGSVPSGSSLAKQMLASNNQSKTKLHGTQKNTNDDWRMTPGRSRSSPLTRSNTNESIASMSKYNKITNGSTQTTSTTNSNSSNRKAQSHQVVSSKSGQVNEQHKQHVQNQKQMHHQLQQKGLDQSDNSSHSMDINDVLNKGKTASSSFGNSSESSFDSDDDSFCVAEDRELACKAYIVQDLGASFYFNDEDYFDHHVRPHVMDDDVASLDEAIEEQVIVETMLPPVGQSSSNKSLSGFLSQSMKSTSTASNSPAVDRFITKAKSSKFQMSVNGSHSSFGSSDDSDCDSFCDATQKDVANLAYLKKDLNGGDSKRQHWGNTNSTDNQECPTIVPDRNTLVRSGSSSRGFVVTMPNGTKMGLMSRQASAGCIIAPTIGEGDEEDEEDDEDEVDEENPHGSALASYSTKATQKADEQESSKTLPSSATFKAGDQSSIVQASPETIRKRMSAQYPIEFVGVYNPSVGDYLAKVKYNCKLATSSDGTSSLNGWVECDEQKSPKALSRRSRSIVSLSEQPIQSTADTDLSLSDNTTVRNEDDFDCHLALSSPTDVSMSKKNINRIGSLDSCTTSQSTQSTMSRPRPSLLKQLSSFRSKISHASIAAVPSLIRSDSVRSKSSTNVLARSNSTRFHSNMTLFGRMPSARTTAMISRIDEVTYPNFPPPSSKRRGTRKVLDKLMCRRQVAEI